MPILSISQRKTEKKGCRPVLDLMSRDEMAAGTRATEEVAGAGVEDEVVEVEVEMEEEEEGVDPGIERYQITKSVELREIQEGIVLRRRYKLYPTTLRLSNISQTLGDLYLNS